MRPILSVVIPTHNPNQFRLQRTLDGLRSQTLPKDKWEMIVVDNATPDPQYIYNFDLSWHISAKVIVEKSLGLTRARLAGIQSCSGDYIVFVDDDNVLDQDYLSNVIDIFANYPHIGGIGGKSLPDFEITPEKWIKDFWVCLALRDLGDEILTYTYNQTSSSHKEHPSFSPIGAGMAIRQKAGLQYVDILRENPNRTSLDRTGKSLQSGGDCDINLTLLEHGRGIGYFPQLRLTHLISANRVTKDYLAKLNYASSRSWIQVLDFHKIRPWKKISSWTVMPRKIKAFFNYQAWKNPESFVKWRGACGTFEALARLS